MDKCSYFYLVILFTSWMAHTMAVDTVNVIIVTYKRSGSSYTGELLSIQENASYFFEPLAYAQLVLQRFDSPTYKSVMTDLMLCNQDLLGQLSKRLDGVWVIRKFGNVSDEFRDEALWPKEKLRDLCVNSGIHVAKTIRLRLEDAHQLVMEGKIPNLRIVHLLRDPRGRYSSAAAEGGNWADSERSISGICGEMEQDLRYWNAHRDQLNHSVYFRLRYEDLVTNPKAISRLIYENLYGIPYTKTVESYIDEHNKAEHSSRHLVETSEYYGTFRNSSFDPTAWKNKLSSTQLADLQKHCQYVIDQSQ